MGGAAEAEAVVVSGWVAAADAFDRRPVTSADLDALLDGLTLEELEVLAREVDDDLRGMGML